MLTGEREAVSSEYIACAGKPVRHLAKQERRSTKGGVKQAAWRGGDHGTWSCNGWKSRGPLGVLFLVQQQAIHQEYLVQGTVPVCDTSDKRETTGELATAVVESYCCTERSSHHIYCCFLRRNAEAWEVGNLARAFNLPYHDSSSIEVPCSPCAAHTSLDTPIR